MKSPLKVLLVEDSPADADLIVFELRRAGFAPNAQRVETKSEYLARLNDGFDLILADFNLPHFDGISALQLLREQHLDVPFILVSGAIGEDLAVEAIKAGASDYVLKDRLGRLGTAVNNALEQRRMRTRHRLLEEQLRHSQKMEAFGTLAGGVAHDFNNLLTVISGYNQMIFDELAPESPLRGYAGEVDKAAQRAASLTRQLLAFCRQQVLKTRVLDLNEALTDIGKMLGRLIGEKINVVILPGDNLWPVQVDRGQIDQVMINLAANSRDAMPDGGTLTIRTANVSVSDSEGDSHPIGIAPGDYALIEVEDTGCGIANEVKAKVFDPFFTTKPLSNGSGLGLATCYGIVKQSGGHISVESEVGHGAKFKIYLPRVEKAPQPKEDDEDVEVSGGNETILLVEDEEPVRSMAASMLKLLGYRVIEAANGREAIEAARSFPEKLDLVMSDIVMPEMGGGELAKWMRSAFPDTRILFISGYPNHAFEGPDVLGPGMAFLPKPFVLKTLACQIRALLND